MVSKNYDNLLAVVLDLFCQEMANTVSSFHMLLIHDNNRCAQASITTLDYLNRQVKEEPRSVKPKQQLEDIDTHLHLKE